MMTYFKVLLCWPIAPPLTKLINRSSDETAADVVKDKERLESNRLNLVKRPNWDTNGGEKYPWWTLGDPKWPYAQITIDTSSWPISFGLLTFHVATVCIINRNLGSLISSR
jgi:hypothetical protein